MLRPKDLQATDYTVALKPTLGYEQQLYVSTGVAIQPGVFSIQALNSGVYTASVADTAALAAAPAELLAVLETELNGGASDTVLTVTGTDSTGAALTGTATFSVPAYSQFTDRVFPKGFAVEVIPTVDGKLWKTITSIAVAGDALATGATVALFGVPSLSTFRQIGAKTQMNYSMKVALPHSVQVGRDMSKFIKAGEFPEGAMEFTAKIPTFSDGLARINGRRVTGLVKEIKEDKLDVMHIFFMGLIMTSKPTVGESVDPATLAAEAKFEDIGVVLAH
jgi:hypothetical protein